MSLYEAPDIQAANSRLQELLKEDEVKQKQIIDEQQKLIDDQNRKRNVFLLSRWKERISI